MTGSGSGGTGAWGERVEGSVPTPGGSLRDLKRAVAEAVAVVVLLWLTWQALVYAFGPYTRLRAELRASPGSLPRVQEWAAALLDDPPPTHEGIGSVPLERVPEDMFFPFATYWERGAFSEQPYVYISYCSGDFACGLMVGRAGWTPSASNGDAFEKLGDGVWGVRRRNRGSAAPFFVCLAAAMALARYTEFRERRRAEAAEAGAVGAAGSTGGNGRCREARLAVALAVGVAVLLVILGSHYVPAANAKIRRSLLARPEFQVKIMQWAQEVLDGHPADPDGQRGAVVPLPEAVPLAIPGTALTSVRYPGGAADAGREPHLLLCYSAGDTVANLLIGRTGWRPEAPADRWTRHERLAEGIWVEYDVDPRFIAVAIFVSVMAAVATLAVGFLGARKGGAAKG